MGISANLYASFVSRLPNEVAMWYVAGGLLMQEVVRLAGHPPFGGLELNSPDGLENECPKLSLLDLCSGSGILPAHLSAVCPFLDVTCVDTSQEAIEAGRQTYGHLGWRFFEADAIALSLDRQFQIITFSSGYHHIQDDQKVCFLKVVERHLADGGLAIVCENFIPNHNLHNRDAVVSDYHASLREEVCHRSQPSMVMLALLRWVELCDTLQTEGEHKVPWERFIDDVTVAGLKVEQDILVWSPNGYYRDRQSGSHVITLRK